MYQVHNGGKKENPAKFSHLRGLPNIIEIHKKWAALKDLEGSVQSVDVEMAIAKAVEQICGTNWVMQSNVG